jgi:hypothetical protein
MTGRCSDLPNFIANRISDCDTYQAAERIMEFAANNWQFIAVLIVAVIIANIIARAIASKNS